MAAMIDVRVCGFKLQAKCFDLWQHVLAASRRLIFQNFVWRCDVKFETVAFVLSAAKWNEKSNFNKQGIYNELKSHFCRIQSSLNRTTNEKENFIFEIMKIDSIDWHCRDSDDYVSSRPTEYGMQQWKLTREESSFPSFRPKLFLNMLNL